MMNKYQMWYVANRDRLLVYQAEYRQKHREELRLKQMGYRHPCLDCGRPVSMAAKRCRSCAMKIVNAKFKKVYPPCINCGGPTSRGRSKRCHKCSSIYRRKWPRLDDDRFIDRGGYIKVRNPNPTRKGEEFLFEHRIVWAKFHNRCIPKGWHIHHLNGVRTDNRPENLVALAPKNHPRRTLVEALQVRIRQLEQLHLPF